MGNALSIDIGGFIFGCWDRCFKRATSLSQLENNLGNLQNKRDRLKARSDDTLDKVNIEEAEPLHEVAAWWKEVDDAIAKADNLLRTRQQEIEKLCLGGCCSKNCVSSIIFQRKVIESLQQVDELCGRNLGAIVQPRPVVVQAKIPLDEPVGLETTFDKAWRCLVEENIGILGLWGMGGVGKTTLVKQIYNKFCATGLVPIWAVVSKDYNRDKVQEAIGGQLGIRQDEQWKKQAPEMKASRISNKLRGNKFCKNKFVLILDDIWDYIDLTEVGVHTEQSETKIIFTTRSESVCGKMNAKAIKVEPLTQQEAWKLFTKKIGEDILKIPGICSLAKAVARECHGLPLAVVIISRAMSGKKTLEEWKHAHQVLRKAASKFEDMERKVFSRLKFSYDSLPDDKVKSCFLYCSLFPEDYKIEKDLLIDHLICEELIEGENYEIDLRNKGYFDIGNLVQVGLLEEDGVDFVRMHDVIRDMALWIAEKRFVVKSGIRLNKVPSVGQWQGAKRMSLMQNSIEKIEEVPECHNLSTLFLNGNPLVSMHDDFFQSMNALTVLDLSHTYLEELPSGITKLVSLQSLNLSGTPIKELPRELNVELKFLSIERTSRLVKIPRNLLSSLKRLQILRMLGCLYFESRNQEGRQVLVEEVSLLKHLSVLSVSVCDAATLQQLPSCIHALNAQEFEGAESLDIPLFTEMKEIRVYTCNSLREFNVSSTRGGGKAQATSSSMYNSTIVVERSFNSLRIAVFFRCDHLLHLTWLILAPNLRILRVMECQSITEIISAEKLGEIPEAGGNRNLFGKLEILKLGRAPNLKSIYWSALPFPSLKTILVEGCPGLKRLPLNSNSAKDCKLVIEGRESWWNNVEWEDDDTKSTFIPCFHQS